MTEATIVSFKDYLWQNRRNRIILLLAAAAAIVQFGVFKYFYPFASYIHGDSFSYLDAAYYNSDIDTYPVGYARLLRLFSVFSRSDMALTAFQYLMLQSSSLFFLFTLFYFYRPGKVMQLILTCFMVLNPLFLYMANLVSSDGFFLALSLTWFTLLLWLLHRPSTRVVMWHALVIFIAFTVRYNALLYPFISLLVFFFSQMSLLKKLAGIGTAFLLCGLFILYTGNKYKELTGTWQYSPFSGWLWSNNAMYAYRYVDSAQRKPVPPRFRELDQMVRTYFDSSRDVRKHPEEAMMASTVYMWDPRFPLYRYREKLLKTTLLKKDSSASEFKKWAVMGPFFKDYGTYIILQYPFYYARYFLAPNALKYYSPPVEFLQFYNSGRYDVSRITQAWFNYKSQEVFIRLRNNEAVILIIFPTLSGMMNVVFLCGLVCYMLMGGLRQRTSFRIGMALTTTLWVLNAGFTIFASSAALRFQAFPLLLVTTFALLMVDWLCQLTLDKETASKKQLAQAMAEIPTPA